MIIEKDEDDLLIDYLTNESIELWFEELTD
jgi:hypothetical protein